jgi:hypothetical protein
MTFASDLGELSMPLREIAELPDSILHLAGEIFCCLQ